MVCLAVLAPPDAGSQVEIASELTLCKERVLIYVLGFGYSISNF